MWCLIAACVGASAACFRPDTDDVNGEGIAPPVDLFTPDASLVPVCMTADPSPLSALDVSVRTTSAGGRFAPRNVGAIWVERADGEFVKTIKRWGQQRAKYLTRFVAASNNNLVDAITGATLTAHTTHEVTWNLKDLEGCEIASGDYQLVFELADGNSTGRSRAVPFAKDQAALVLSPEDAPSFYDVRVDLH
jgi:hypothetical protein